MVELALLLQRDQGHHLILDGVRGIDTRTFEKIKLLHAAELRIDVVNATPQVFGSVQLRDR